MVEQPCGTVTFLFSDIEGSTRLLQELGRERYAEALDLHRRLLREAFERHGGYEVDYEGDAFSVAFQSAEQAIAAAAQAQQALAEASWPEEKPIRVRIGIHTGEPALDPPKYVGIDVHKAARIMSAGHGGQTLLSSETRKQLDDHFLTRDLGEHRLKDFEEPVWLYQLGEEDFPPLKTISNTNLPRPVSSFVGRARELAEVLALFHANARLVTLTGPGGSGKTRLATETATELIPECRNGVFWVGLAPLRDPALVLETIGQVVGAKDGLAEHIQDREMLLLLDNLEQVVDAAPDVSVLLRACPNLRVLVTSRELLRIEGEREYPVAPLAEADAVALFCERSRLEADETIAQLCRRLDNLPLAVELAAARTRVLSPAQILQRLSQRLDLFRGGRDADPRQQTLRATIEWSYDLLAESEQRLFRRLSVFAGGSALEAAEEVADAELDTLQSLVEKSLLRFSDERYRMLETIREYAAERLDATGEEHELQRHHADYFVALAEQAEPAMWGAENQVAWVGRLETELDNLRAALHWAVESEQAEVALRLVGALYRFWEVHPRFAEAQGWLARALELRGAVEPGVRARALLGAGRNARWTGDLNASVSLLQESLAIWRSLGHKRELSHCLRFLGYVLWMVGEQDAGVSMLEEAVQVARELGDARSLAAALHNRGFPAEDQGDLVRARALYEEALALHRSFRDKAGIAHSLIDLGAVALLQSDYGQADRFLREGLAVAAELGQTGWTPMGLGFSGLLALFEGRESNAERLLRGALVSARDQDLSEEVAECLHGLAALAAARDQPVRAACLWGASEALLEALHHRLWAVHRAVSARFAPQARAAIDSAEWEQAWAEGRAMSEEEAVASALAGMSQAHAPEDSRRTRLRLARAEDRPSEFER